MTPLRIGVVGLNYAAGTHLPVYAALVREGLVELAAVATAHRDTADEAARTHGVPRAHVGFEALCADPDVDLVDVATRPSRHAAMATAAFAAGKHVLCEAPLARSTAEGLAMADAAAVSGRLAVVDMQSRFWPGLAELRRRVSEGWIGRVDNVAVQAFYPTFTMPAAVSGSGWCADAAHGASSLRVHGLHTADILRWVFGGLSDVRGVVARRAPSWPGPDGPLPADSVDSAAWVARLDGEGLCSVHSSWVAPAGAGWRLVAHGSEGVLLAEAAGHTGHFPVRLSGARAGEEVTEIVAAAGAATEPFTRLVRALVARVAGDDAAGDLPTFADGVAALRVADAVDGGLTSGD
ncbi:oxidoreductase [Actinomycetospora sp. NBRC 106375]|uniref:Gfo/Idh/MocA family protein n=1 Tax=Actinomycetospora sp. NBRC 106375 TaxID=3032207 RepID=UPI0024A38811|nr:Gfo/Idh/MocA family oxidoreductase [Actinomycetospora sp. NBRC 106375]GLZ43979.1 oxidoreductase [Actinomycetospora sp. NBRC 106375]